MQTAISSIVVFLLLIIAHEFGHFIIAKKVGIKVNEFAIGMGPKVLQTSDRETKYTLRLLPIGGYVAMEGEDVESSDPRSFDNASPFKRIAVVAAGALMNFVLAIVVLIAINMMQGVPTATIAEVDPAMPAYSAGIQSGDRVVSIDDVTVKTWKEIQSAIDKGSEDKPLTITLERNGQSYTYRVPVVVVNGDVRIGVTSLLQKSVSGAIIQSFGQFFMIIGLLFDFIGNVLRGAVGFSDVSGPVGVVSAIGQASSHGVVPLLSFFAYISINLGFVNLLPIPALDGSKILLTVIEIIRGKPISKQKESVITMIGFGLLMLLIVVISFNDIRNLIR